MPKVCNTYVLKENLNRIGILKVEKGPIFLIFALFEEIIWYYKFTNECALNIKQAMMFLN